MQATPPFLGARVLAPSDRRKCIDALEGDAALRAAKSVGICGVNAECLSTSILALFNFRLSRAGVKLNDSTLY